jgi:hypothetical protein
MTDKEKIDSLEARIVALELQLAKYKGFIGAIVFVGSCVWGIITFVVPFLKHGS